MKKAQQEVDSFDWEREELNYDTIGKFGYLEACMWEGLRLYPPANRIERESVVPYKLGDTEPVITNGRI